MVLKIFTFIIIFLIFKSKCFYCLNEKNNSQLDIINFLIESIQNDQKEYAIIANRSHNSLDLSPLFALLPDNVILFDTFYLFNSSQPVKEFLDLIEKISLSMIEIRTSLQGYLTTNSSNQIISLLKQVKLDNSELKNLSICFLEQTLEPNVDKTCWNQFLSPLAVAVIKNFGFFSSINQQFANYTRHYQLDIFTLCLKEKKFFTCLTDNKFLINFIENQSIENILLFVSSIEKFSNQNVKSVFKNIPLPSFQNNSNNYYINGLVCLTALLIEPKFNQKCIINYPFLSNKDLLHKASKLVDQLSFFVGRSLFIDNVSKNLKKLSELDHVKTPIDSLFASKLLESFLHCLRENFDRINKVELCIQNDTAMIYLASSNITECLKNDSIECLGFLSGLNKNSSLMILSMFHYFNKNETYLNEFLTFLVNNLDQVINMTTKFNMTTAQITSTLETQKNGARFRHFIPFVYSIFTYSWILLYKN